MIYCPQCGNPNFDDANFCDTCGEPLVNEAEYAKMRNAAEMQQLLEAQRRQREQQAYNKAYRKAQKEAKRAANAKAAANKKGSKNANATEPQTEWQPGQEKYAVYKHGCLTQAWDDITETKGWAKKIIMLGIVNMIPILNFFVTGFAMKWARQLPLDEVKPMPEKIFDDGNFLQGFYAFIITLVVGLVSGICSTVLGLIPILGIICALAVSLFMYIFEYLAIMRVSIAKNLGPGFDIKSIWGVIKEKRFGALFCATVLPSIIVGCAILFVCGSVFILFGMNSFTALINEYQYQQQMQQMQMMNPFFSMMGMTPTYDLWGSILGQAISLVPLFFVLYLITAFLMALSQVLTLRATAHYVARYNRNWAALQNA